MKRVMLMIIIQMKIWGQCYGVDFEFVHDYFHVHNFCDYPHDDYFQRVARLQFWSRTVLATNKFATFSLWLAWSLRSVEWCLVMWLELRCLWILTTSGWPLRSFLVQNCWKVRCISLQICQADWCSGTSSRPTFLHCDFISFINSSSSRTLNPLILISTILT